MALSDLQKKVYKGRILNPAFGFAESGQFERRRKKRPLGASVTLRAEKIESEGTHDEYERIELFFLRDESDADVGGVAILRPGDLYYRDPEFDPDHSRPYRWTGEKLEEGRHYTRATFQRYKNVSQGKGIN